MEKVTSVTFFFNLTGLSGRHGECTHEVISPNVIAISFIFAANVLVLLFWCNHYGSYFSPYGSNCLDRT